MLLSVYSAALMRHNLPVRISKRVFVLVLAVLVLATGGAWLFIGKSGLVQQPHWAKPAQPIPVISTRGHLADGKLTAGHTPYDYDVVGIFPGISEDAPPLKSENGEEASPQHPLDLIIVVHGFNNTAEKAAYKFEIARESLARNGYGGAIAGFSWDADTQRDPMAMTGYHEAKRNAIANGAKLAAFIADYRRRNPDVFVHILGYSMGARIALEALVALDDDPKFAAVLGKPIVASMHLIGAAVKNDEAETGERYGGAIERETGVLYNYYSTEDNKLSAYFPLKEAGRALGDTDIEHRDRKPANYLSVDATRELPKFDSAGNVDEEEFGDNHSAYLGTRADAGRLIDDGVMNLVAANIAGMR